MIIKNAFLKLMSLCLEFIITLTRADGIKHSKFVACAMCCSKFINKVNSKIRTEPPPKA